MSVAVSPEDYQDQLKNWGSQTWRLHNFYWIRDKESRVVRFKPNWAQSDLYDNLWYLNLILKARQLGFTTEICILFLDWCVFTPETQAGIIAHNREDAEDFFFNKVKFAYDRLPETVTSKVTAVSDSARMLRFSNGSSIKVGTSMRSGTLNLLHVSEFGKICAKYPLKAQEIVSGAFNTVQAGQLIFVESTAEGQGGYFYDYCKAAEDKAKLGTQLTPLDFKFFFYPWWKHPEYALDPEGVVITKELDEYFRELAQKHGILLTPAQKAWYVKKAETQGDLIMREYPSTPEEAFQASVKGAYYDLQMARVRKEKRICKVPFEPSVPVNTGWDLGMDDYTTIWFHQRVGIENRIINYYEASGYGLEHYAQFLQRLAQESGYIYGKHFLPHDANVRELGTGKSRVEKLESLGFRNIEVIGNDISLADQVEAVRTFLATSWFDEVNAAKGVRCLDNYRKKWDDKIGGWRDEPLHDWASHGADGFRSLAVGFNPRKVMKESRRVANRRRDGRVV
jgi:hypothetical protein